METQMVCKSWFVCPSTNASLFARGRVRGDCVFVSFAQGLTSLGLGVGLRRLRKVAWQSLKKDPVAKGLWDGCMPAAVNLAGDWSSYLQ